MTSEVRSVRPEVRPDVRPDVWVVVGLGNPGPAYAGTRHNAGYLVVDELVSRVGGQLRAHRSGRAAVLEGRLRIGGPRGVLGPAPGHMYEARGPVAAPLSFYKGAPDQPVVAHE